MLMAPMTIDFGAKHGHDLHQILTKSFHRRFIRCLIEDRDLHSHELANLKDDFAPEPEQANFVHQNQFFDFAL